MSFPIDTIIILAVQLIVFGIGFGVVLSDIRWLKDQFNDILSIRKKIDDVDSRVKHIEWTLDKQREIK